MKKTGPVVVLADVRADYAYLKHLRKDYVRLIEAAGKEFQS